MKSKFLVLGCLVAGICFLTNCKEDEEQVDTSIKGISIAPTTVAPMEIGAEIELTATITPSDAKGTIEWVSNNTSFVTVTPVAGTNKATIKAIAAGTTQVFARSDTRTAVSNEVTVTVNLPPVETDFAEILVADGPFVGKGTPSLLPVEITMGISFTRVSKNVVTIDGKSSMGALVCYAGQTITLVEGSSPNICKLINGKATMPEAQPDNGEDLPVTVIGEYNTTTKKLSLTIQSDLQSWEANPLIIPIEAVPGEYEEPDIEDGDLVLDCWGSATGLGPAVSFTDIKVNITQVDAKTFTVAFNAAILPPVLDGIFTGNLTLTGNELSGKMTYEGALAFDVTGSLDMDNEKIALTLSTTYEYAQGMVTTIVINVTNIEEPDFVLNCWGYYNLASKVDISDVEVSLWQKDDETVSLSFVVDIQNIGVATISGELDLSGNDLSGKVTLTATVMGSQQSADLNATGTFDPDAGDGEITLNISGTLLGMYPLTVMLTNVAE